MSKTKKIKNFIIDSMKEIIETLFLIIVFIIPFIINLSGLLKKVLSKSDLTIENIKYYFLSDLGNGFIGIVFFVIVLYFIREKINKNQILNKGNIYHDKPYLWYWYCSKILGYEKCNLILVPIHMQFKLILRDTFNEYPFDERIFPEKECKIEVNMITKNKNLSNKIVNFIIQDTYLITENQIPLEFLNNVTISISRYSEKIGERVYSKELVDTIVEEVRRLEDGTTINMFLTTNPKNTYEIVKKAITSGSRGNFESVYVFQQESYGERKFKDIPYKVL